VQGKEEEEGERRRQRGQGASGVFEPPLYPTKASWNLPRALTVCLNCGSQKRGRQYGPSVSGLAAVFGGWFSRRGRTGSFEKVGEFPERIA